MPSFRPARCVELSTLDYLSDQISADWSGVTILKSFHQAYDKGVNLPIVSIRLASTNNFRKEIGNTALDNRFLIIIDIFARSSAQRLDLADYIETKLSAGYTYSTYAHQSGDKTQLVATSAGRCTVVDWITNEQVEIPQVVNSKDRFRHTISVLVRFST